MEELREKRARSDDWNAAKRMEHQQIVVSSHDAIRFGRQRTLEQFVILRIPADVQ